MGLHDNLLAARRFAATVGFGLLRSDKCTDELVLHLRCNRIRIESAGAQKLTRVVDVIDPRCFDVYRLKPRCR